MASQKVIKAKTSVLHFSKILLFETGYISLTFFGYYILSLLYFGEGSGSFAYSLTNSIVYVGLLIVPPTVFNIFKLMSYTKKDIPHKVKAYILAQLLLIVVFVLFMLIERPFNGY
jgi:hypothetical protein